MQPESESWWQALWSSIQRPSALGSTPWPGLEAAHVKPAWRPVCHTGPHKAQKKLEQHTNDAGPCGRGGGGAEATYRAPVLLSVLEDF